MASVFAAIPADVVSASRGALHVIPGDGDSQVTDLPGQGNPVIVQDQRLNGPGKGVPAASESCGVRAESTAEGAPGKLRLQGLSHW